MSDRGDLQEAFARVDAAFAEAEQASFHPKHYGGEDAVYETIKVLEAWLSFDEFIGFCRGNAIKYQSRAGKKAGADCLTDLAKAKFYADYEQDYRRRHVRGHIGEKRVRLVEDKIT